VAGATGYLGSRLVAALRLQGVPVTAIVRDHADSPELRRLGALGATVIAVDAAREEPYRRALVDADVAISCMASRNTGGNSANDFWAIDRDATTRFGLAAVAGGVRQVVLVATFGGPAARHLSQFSEAKEQAVDAVAVACAAAGIALTVIRPTAYFSDLTNRAFESVERSNRYTTVGDGLHRINPIDGNDVAEFILCQIATPIAGNRQLPVGGPDILTFNDIGRLAADSLGRQAQLRIRRIPIGLLRALAHLTGTAGHCSRRLRRSAAILNWMIYAGTHDAVAPCVGQWHLRDVFAAKRLLLDSQRPVVRASMV
jgi:divinyl chlorophyllide a 8-vinyl-reductase